MNTLAYFAGQNWCPKIIEANVMKTFFHCQCHSSKICWSANHCHEFSVFSKTLQLFSAYFQILLKLKFISFDEHSSLFSPRNICTPIGKEGNATKTFFHCQCCKISYSVHHHHSSFFAGGSSSTEKVFVTDVPVLSHHLGDHGGRRYVERLRARRSCCRRRRNPR
jgi:hypothetical protein